MRRRHKKSVMIIALALAIIMVLTMVTGVLGTILAQGTPTNLGEIDRQINQARNELSNLEGQAGAIDAQMATLGERLSVLQAQEDGYLEELSVLQEQLELLRERILLTEEQIAIYQRMILDKETRLEEAIQREQDQLERYKLRIRAMEEMGSLSYIQILLTARSFSDLLTRIHDANEVMAYDQRISAALERYREAVQDYKVELEEDRLGLEILIAQLERERTQLETEEAAVQARIDEIEEKIEANLIEWEVLEAEYQRISEEILARAQDLSALDEARQAAIAEMQRQAAAGNFTGGGGMSQGSRPGTGMFMWPSDVSTRVTSSFGPRPSPGGIGSTNHQGVDIGAPYGSNVLAAASGVVTFSGWSGGFGNFILINHGNGIFTAYAHSSRNLVQQGETVIQGQVIALVGSTGNSTGPHIHFEVIINGVRVDPMQFF